MKAPNKYGSSYPLASSRNTRRASPQRKAREAQEAPTSTSSSTPMPALALPHERDEAVDQGGGAVHSDSVQQAFQDVKQGRPDTDRSVEVNKTYQKQKV